MCVYSGNTVYKYYITSDPNYALQLLPPTVEYVITGRLYDTLTADKVICHIGKKKTSLQNITDSDSDFHFHKTSSHSELLDKELQVTGCTPQSSQTDNQLLHYSAVQMFILHLELSNQIFCFLCDKVASQYQISQILSMRRTYHNMSVIHTCCPHMDGWVVSQEAVVEETCL